MLKLAPRGEAKAPHSIGRVANEGGSITFSEILLYLRRHLPTIAISALAAFAIGLSYILITKPLYTATAQLIIDPEAPRYALAGDLRDPVAIPLDSANVESQLAILRSDGLAIRVIDELKLTEDPEFCKDEALCKGQHSLPASEIGGTLRPPIEAERYRSAIEVFSGNLEARRVALSYAIDVSYRSSDAEKSALIANAVANAYIRDLTETRSQEARRGSEWLQGRMDELRTKLNVATQAVQEFKAKRDYRIFESGKRAQEGEGGRLAQEGVKRIDQTTLEELETTANTYRKMYESYLEAFTQTVQKQSYSFSNARVITVATRPFKKSHPRTGLILALSGLVGTLAGIAIAIGRLIFDSRVRSSQQLRDEVDLECLGEMPVIRITPQQKKLDLAALRKRFSRSAAAPESRSTFVEVIEAPSSRFSAALQTGANFA